jgi:hypothetical protein
MVLIYETEYIYNITYVLEMKVEWGNLIIHQVLDLWGKG